MDCDMFLNMLDNYDNLSELEKEQLSNHAKECESCRRELEFLESVIATTKTLPKLEVGEDFLKDLNLRIDKEDIKLNRHTRHFKRNWQKYSAVAASLVLVAVIGANSDMFVDKMGNNDSGVIDEVATTVAPKSETVALPATETPKNEPSKSENAEKTEKTVQTQNADTKTEAVTVRENAVPAVSGNSQRNVQRATATPKSTAAATLKPTAKPAQEEMPSYTSEPVATDEPQNDDNGYSLTTDAPVGQYAMGEDYSISSSGTMYEIGIMTVNSKQDDRAMGILIECINGSVGDCYTINASDLGTLEARLTNAGVEFDAYMPEHDGIITFKIVKY